MGYHGAILWRIIPFLVLISVLCANGIVGVSEDKVLSDDDSGSGHLPHSLEVQVQELKKHFTKLYISDDPVRKKRSYTRQAYDIQVDQKDSFFAANVTSVNAYPFVCYGKAFVLQSDGVYRLDFINNEVPIYTENGSFPGLVKINEWSVDTGDRVLDVKEWEQKCFVFMTNHNGTFFSMYTLHGHSMQPVNRQQMRNNDGFTMAAKFFTIKRNLYLIIVNDNAVHSLTLCPLFRWTGTYMDQIHKIQTRGATAVETFAINSREYIAIAQSQDPAGNYEVGTQILRMDSKEQLEKVQLLWSNNPNSLQYVQVKEEHYLIVGQAREPSIVYWFGGMDFVHWQTLKNYNGQKLFMDSFLLPDKIPVVLAAKGSSVKFYSWSTTLSSLAPTSNSSALSFMYPLQFSNAKFIRLLSQVYLTIVDNDKQHPSLKVYPIITYPVEIAVSQIKESENQLSQCMKEVRQRLVDDEQSISSMNDARQKILTKSGAVKFDGTITTAGNLLVNPESTTISTLNVWPSNFTVDDGYYSTPSYILNNLKGESQKVVGRLIPQLSNVLMKSLPGTITGSYTFVNGLDIINMDAAKTNLQLEKIHGIPWTDIQVYAIRKYSEGSQNITGNWTVAKMSVLSTIQVDEIAGIEIGQFWLTKCSLDEEDQQDILGHVVFASDVHFNDGVIMQPDGKVNNVTISDVVLKNGPISEIRGYKHALNLIGDAGFGFNYINGRDFAEWINSVIHIDGEEQYSTGSKTFSAVGATNIEHLNPNLINGRDWSDFYLSVLRNGTDQKISGDIVMERLDVENLEAISIGQVRFEDLLNANGSQSIASNLTFSSLTIQSDLQTELINGIPLSELALHQNENVTIYGPIELENCKVKGSITIEDESTIAGKDISKLGKMRKKHIYYTNRGSTVYMRAPIQVEDLNTPITNGYLWDDLHSHFWTKSSDKSIDGPLDLRGRKVFVQKEYNTGTVNKIDLNADLVSLDGPLTISTPLSFVGDVYVFGNIEQHHGKTLNGMDISQISNGIVKVNEKRMVRGIKFFRANLIASRGLNVDEINSINLTDQLIYLNSSETQYLQDLKYFKSQMTIKSFHSDGDIIVGGSVNGHNLSRVYQSTAFQDQPLTIYGNTLFNQSFYASTLTIQKELNDVNLPSLLENVIFLDEPQTINFSIILNNGEFAVQQNSVVGEINGITLTEYLPRVVLLSPPNSRINGTKTFRYLQAKDIGCHYFNGISLMNLSKSALSLTKPQNISGKFHFGSVKIDSNLETTKIGDVAMNDLVFIDDLESCGLDTDVVFTGGVKLNGLLSIGGNLNGYPVEKLEQGDFETGLHGRNFNSVIILGSLDWEDDAQQDGVISDVLHKAVTLDTPQTITGTIVFANGFDATELEATPWVNGIDLDLIQNDAVLKDSSEFVFQGLNTFTGRLEIQDSEIFVGMLNATKVDEIVLKDYNDEIIRDNFNGTIYGTKTFDQDLNVDNLLFKDLQNSGDFNWLATNNGNKTINHLILFAPVRLQKLDYNVSHQFDIDKFLKNRLTTDGDQTIHGNYTVDSLSAGECNIETINDIPFEDIFQNSQDKQVLDGRKTFKNGIYIDGEADVADVNGYDFESLHSDVYRRGQKEKINRPVIFVQPVTFSESVQVDNDINDYRIDELSARFSKALEGVEARAQANHKPQIQNLERLAELNQELTDKPMWLEYLRLKQDWRILGPNIRVEYTPADKGGIIALHDHASSKGDFLPNGCMCNSVRFLKIDATSRVTANASMYFECASVFIVTSDSGNLYTVADHSVSYNLTCKTKETAALTISKGSKDDLLLMDKSKGYLADVKAFYDNGIDYLMLAYFFDAKNGNHDSGTYVYKVDDNKITLIQTISTSGAVRLAINNMDGEWYAAIANGRDPKEDSCLTNSAIYRWKSLSQRFYLLRDVRTNGALDVTFISVQDKRVNYEVDAPSISFVAFAQSGNSGDGEVTILSYDAGRKNYFVVQSLRTKWSVTALEFFCIQENCYLMTVVPQEGILFFEYRYVEGFQLSLTIPVVEAQDIIPFPSGRLRERVLFAIASTEKSLLAEGVIAGQPYLLDDGEDDLHNNYEYSLKYVE